jgi:hypothetical protein
VPQLAHGARAGEQDATAALAVDIRWDRLLLPRSAFGPETATRVNMFGIGSTRCYRHMHSMLLHNSMLAASR